MRHARAITGFTFVEVLAALTFLAILIPSVLGALSLANRAAVMSERETVALQLADNKLNELIVTDQWSSGNGGGDFGQDYTGYRWEMSQATSTDTQMTEVTVTVYFQVQGKEHSVSLTTLHSSTLTQG
jgi:type II secretion system protein I